jgi:hypothetical protein
VSNHEPIDTTSFPEPSNPATTLARAIREGAESQARMFQMIETLEKSIREVMLQRNELKRAAEMFLGCLPADMSIWRELGLDTSLLTLARLKTVAAIARVEAWTAPRICDHCNRAISGEPVTWPVPSEMRFCSVKCAANEAEAQGLAKLAADLR